MKDETPIEETNGYKVAIAFKPFIDPKCSERMEIVKDMAKAINGLINKVTTSDTVYIKKIEILEKQLAFERGERVTVKGLLYQKGINENSFAQAVNTL